MSTITSTMNSQAFLPATASTSTNSQLLEVIAQQPPTPVPTSHLLKEDLIQTGRHGKDLVQEQLQALRLQAGKGVQVCTDAAAAHPLATLAATSAVTGAIGFVLGRKSPAIEQGVRRAAGQASAKLKQIHVGPVAREVGKDAVLVLLGAGLKTAYDKYKEG